MTTPLSPDTIQELRRLMEQATPGPWNYIEAKTLIHLETGPECADGAGIAIASFPKKNLPDVALIYAMHTALPALLAAAGRVTVTEAAMIRCDNDRDDLAAKCAALEAERTGFNKVSSDLNESLRIATCTRDAYSDSAPFISAAIAAKEMAERERNAYQIQLSALKREGGTPTQWAYDQACAALNKTKAALDRSEADGKRMREALAACILRFDVAERNGYDLDFIRYLREIEKPTAADEHHFRPERTRPCCDWERQAIDAVLESLEDDPKDDVPLADMDKPPAAGGEGKS